ncbi:MAG: Na(+)-translocating NADH-quinone reductase subunit A, partial [Calditrichaeota bacterium]|nr:Na(+)-translocating NADH-quinone reductase subunit A [Calditrichota bacterium]
GDSLYHSKEMPEIKFTAPVSGKVIEINRGERRMITEVVIEADKQQKYVEFDKYDDASLERASAEDITRNLLNSGLWPSLTKRPYGVLANANKLPRDIFISCFDSAPLAADQLLIAGDAKEAFQFGLNVLKKLTDGSIYLGVDGSSQESTQFFSSFKNVQVNSFKGKHPAGNVGVQIHHVKPINRGDIVWTVSVANVLEIGRLFMTGYLQSNLIVAVAGENAGEHKYFRTHRGVAVERLIAGIKDNSRIISGNVLTGTKIENTGYVGYFDNLVTIIPEGNHHEFLGWILPGFKKESFSGTFPGKFFPAKEYSHNTNLHGGHRSFVQTGYYEKVLPMDILPVHLLKSILTEDIELMEGLGVYEIVEEDLALCEFICPSKVQVQDIVREGFELMIREV